MSEAKTMDRLQLLAELIEKRERQVAGLLGVACGLASTQAEILKHMKALDIKPVAEDKQESA